MATQPRLPFPRRTSPHPDVGDLLHRQSEQLVRQHAAVAVPAEAAHQPAEGGHGDPFVDRTVPATEGDDHLLSGEGGQGGGEGLGGLGGEGDGPALGCGHRHLVPGRGAGGAGGTAGTGRVEQDPLPAGRRGVDGDRLVEVGGVEVELVGQGLDGLEGAPCSMLPMYLSLRPIISPSSGWVRPRTARRALRFQAIRLWSSPSATLQRCRLLLKSTTY